MIQIYIFITFLFVRKPNTMGKKKSVNSGTTKCIKRDILRFLLLNLLLSRFEY